MSFEDYELGPFYDEYFSAPGQLRAEVTPLCKQLATFSPAELVQANAQLMATLTDLGATFNLDGQPQVLPFDLIPRIISASEWQQLEAGLQQRVMALNQFCADIYGEQLMIRDRKIPREVIESAERFLPDCIGMKPARGIWCHVSGIDLVRDRNGTWYVLEDNLRVPSGIAYTIKNRQAMQQVLPQFFQDYTVEPISAYPQHLRQTLSSLSATNAPPQMALLTPGPSESAYFEHQWLAQSTGLALVEPQNLAIHDGFLQHQTPSGWQPIDILYRRRNADFFAPLKLDSSHPSGVAALIDLCQQGRLTIANAFGTGVADDKVVYAYVPDMIRYYLGEEPKLPNVPSYLCWRDQDRDYVLSHLDELVVKAASGEGGRGMLIGPHASPTERAQFAQRIRANPRAYMAQPTLQLSRIPTVSGDHLAGRHVDLRPYILHQGDRLKVQPGGLTRVALRPGSLVVNSTQGGGSKDTWVLRQTH